MFVNLVHFSGQSHVAPLRLSFGEKTDSGSSKKRKPSEASGGPASKVGPFICAFKRHR